MLASRQEAPCSLRSWALSRWAARRCCRRRFRAGAPSAMTMSTGSGSTGRAWLRAAGAGGPPAPRLLASWSTA
eukprot:2558961-Pyramimonas_sp.AAC.1